jgi:hypothetical protein
VHHANHNTSMDLIAQMMQNGAGGGELKSGRGEFEFDLFVDGGVDVQKKFDCEKTRMGNDDIILFFSCLRPTRTTICPQRQICQTCTTSDKCASSSRAHRESDSFSLFCEQYSNISISTTTSFASVNSNTTHSTVKIDLVSTSTLLVS